MHIQVNVAAFSDVYIMQVSYQDTSTVLATQIKHMYSNSMHMCVCVYIYIYIYIYICTYVCIS